jgi:hypothetical protein
VTALPTLIEQASAPMTPEERDRIRSHAAERLRATCGSECSVECRTHRAVLAYVPPGDTTAPEGFTVEERSGGVAYLDGPRTKHGRLFIADAATMRALGLYLIAAADRLAKGG